MSDVFGNLESKVRQDSTLDRKGARTLKARFRDATSSSLISAECTCDE